MPHLDRIRIFPIKALDPVEVETVRVLPGGWLEHDREFAMIDAEGKFINGKRNERVHRLRARVDFERAEVHFRIERENSEAVFSWERDRERMNQWLSEYLEQRILFRQAVAVPFPDDLKSPGPTVISRATLEAVAGWFPGLNVETVRRRFRANLEIAGVPTFWEDRLIPVCPDEPVRFSIGAVEYFGKNACQRCVVPTRDPRGGGAYPNFQSVFVAQRERTLPEWAPRSHFHHFYRLAINTAPARIPNAATLAVGDKVSILPAPTLLN